MIEFCRVDYLTESGVLDFDRSRRWFTENFGWSQDVETRSKLKAHRRKNPGQYQSTDINPVWGYSIKYKDYRIYVASEAELNWYVLSHPAHV